MNKEVKQALYTGAAIVLVVCGVCLLFWAEGAFDCNNDFVPIGLIAMVMNFAGLFCVLRAENLQKQIETEREREALNDWFKDKMQCIKKGIPDTISAEETKKSNYILPQKKETVNREE